MDNIFDRDFDRDFALQFLKELREFSLDIFKRENVEIRDLKHDRGTPKIFKEFHPYGAVIHPTHTINTLDALVSISKRVYDTHFIVCQKPRLQIASKYELISKLPAAIISIVDFTKFCSHSGYISGITYGIDIRNIGRLRPDFNIFGKRPVPIFTSEEDDKMFFYNSLNMPEFYWWRDLWRTKFEGNIQRWGNYYYESVNKPQLISLTILLKVLNTLTPLKNEFIVPSNCIKNQNPILHNIPLSSIKNYMNNKETPNFSNFATKSCSLEWTNLPHSDHFYDYIAQKHLWRTDYDQGETKILSEHKTPANLSTEVELALLELGYDTSNRNVARNMYAIAHNQLYDISHSCVQAPKILKKHKALGE